MSESTPNNPRLEESKEMQTALLQGYLAMVAYERLRGGSSFDTVLKMLQEEGTLKQYADKIDTEMSLAESLEQIISISFKIKTLIADGNFLKPAQSDAAKKTDSGEKRKNQAEVNPYTLDLRKYAQKLPDFFEEHVPQNNFFLEESYYDKVLQSLNEMSQSVLNLTNEEHNEIKQIVLEMFNLIVLVARNQKATLNKLSSLLEKNLTIKMKNPLEWGKIFDDYPDSIRYLPHRFDMQKHKLIAEFVTAIFERIKKVENKHDDNERFLRILLAPVDFMSKQQPPVYFTDQILE